MIPIPYATDAPLDRRPVTNWLIFGGLVLIFFIECNVGFVAEGGKDGLWDRLILILLGRRVSGGYVEPFILHRWGILGMVGHNWFHPNVFQLIGNLLFLWPFGNAVCSKVGNKSYLWMYLGFCFLGGIIHLIISGEPAIGPGVAISGIAGAYLVLFPENSVSCFFFFPRPITLEVSGYFVLSVWLAADIAAAAAGVQTLSFFVHIPAFGAGMWLAVKALRKQWVTIGRGERTFLQVLGKEVPITEEKGEEEEEGKSGGEAKEERREEERVPEPAGAAETRKAEEAAIVFRCECGKRIKAPSRYAGKRVQCPACKRMLKIPAV